MKKRVLLILVSMLFATNIVWAMRSNFVLKRCSKETLTRKLFRAAKKGKDPKYVQKLLHFGADPDPFCACFTVDCPWSNEYGFFNYFHYGYHSVTFSAGFFSPANRGHGRPKETFTLLYDTPYYFNPLYLAVKRGDEEVVQLLLAAGADPNVSRRISSAIQLVRNHEEESERMVSPLYVAVKEGRLNIVRLLLNAGARLDIQNGLLATDPPCYSEYFEHYSRISGPDNLMGGDTPLGVAVRLGYKPIERLLFSVLEEYPDERRLLTIVSGLSSIQLINGHASLQKLLEEKVNVNAQDDEGNSLLHLAIRKEKCLAMRSRGRDVDRKTLKDLLEFFFKIRVNPNIQNSNGDTSLHLVVDYKDKEVNFMTDDYLKASSDYSQNLKRYETTGEIVRMLLDAGADKNIRNNKGQRAADLASNWTPMQSETFMSYGFEYSSIQQILQ